MEKEKKLYVAFCAYIEACKKLNSVLWDSIVSSELLEPHKKQSHFINAFEATSEFKDLIKVLEDWGPRKPDEENAYLEYHEYYLTLQGCLQRFFTNTGIYDRIISGGEFNKERVFNIFLEELEEKEIEVLKYGEVFPLKIGMKKSEVLEFGNFSLLTDLGKYKIDYAVSFAILLHHSMRPHHLGMPCGVDGIEKSGQEEYALGGEMPFSLLLIIFNLYFDRPLYIPKWYERYSSLFSFWYQPECNYSEYSKTISNKFNSDLYDKYFDECTSDSYVDEEDNSYIDWDKFDECLDSKKEEFISSGEAPINYLKEAEVEDFKEFITKIQEFLRSNLYKSQKYLQIAVHYFLMLHERPNIADNLVNYVIALEALYFAQETSEMKEKLANRIANLLGKNSEEKIKIREEMLDIYNLRCKYVHGKITDIDKKFSGKENWLRNLLRLSLLSFFSLCNYYNSNEKREKLLGTLDSVFDSNIIENIQIQAKDFLNLGRP